MTKRRKSSIFVPYEIMHLAALNNLCEFPRKILMLCCVSKSLKFDETFWQRVWEKHRIFWKSQHKRPHHYLDFNPPIFLCKSMLKLVYGMFCSKCGCRYHHSIFETYRKRLCRNCMRDFHISNNVLWQRFGIGLGEIVHIRFFIRHTSMATYLKPEKIEHMTHDLLDLDFKSKQPMVFFWKPDLERFFNLEERRVEHCARVQAVNVLKAFFKLKFVCGTKRRHLVQNLRENENNRVLRPISRHVSIQGSMQCLAYTVCKSSKIRAPEIDQQKAFKAWPPLPLLGPNEFCLKTLGEQFNYRREEILRKANEICKGGYYAQFMHMKFPC
jgi:hypothetical protein